MRIHFSTITFFVFLAGNLSISAGVNCDCDDDDNGLVSISQKIDLGVPNLAGCSDVTASMCTQGGMEGNIFRSFCCETCSQEFGGDTTCRNYETEFQSLGRGSCSDNASACYAGNSLASAVKGLCCSTCSPPEDNDGAPPESILPPADGEPIQLFLQGGQSECTGAAQADDLEADPQTYPKLQGNIEGVWMAGYKGRKRKENFFIAPMSARADGSSRFGPEVAFGERIYAVTGKRTMVVKYCVGGTNVNTHWNPDAYYNDWDRDADDGTSDFLEENANLKFSPSKPSKCHLFANMAYTIRRTEEMLSEAGINFNWAGIVWVQGNADDDTSDPVLWKTFGEDTARVWEGFREQLGGPVPVVDTGASAKNQLSSGKEYATQVVEGCQATTIGYNNGAIDDSLATCIPGPTDPCVESPGMYRNQEIFEYYGWDPKVPDEMKPPESTDKKFAWFVDYPNDLHSAYEGHILKGQMLANAYIREFTDESLGELGDDIATLFPKTRCEDGESPSEENLCWTDYQDEDLKEEICAVVSPQPSAPTAPTVAPEPTPVPTALPTGPTVPTLAPTRRPKKCRDIASNRFDLPRIGRVKERKNVHCRWFRDVYKNKVIKKKYCIRKVKINSGPKKGRMVKLNLVCKAACHEINAGSKQCQED